MGNRLSTAARQANSMNKTIRLINLSELSDHKDIGKTEAQLLDLCARDEIAHKRTGGQIQIAYLLTKDKSGRNRINLIYSKKKRSLAITETLRRPASGSVNAVCM
jgi:hypothetical protein